MVLVDARCLSWLLQSTDDRAGAQAVAAHAGLMQMFGHSLRHAALDLDLVRAYWYTDQAQAQPVADVVLRPVQDPDVDGGLSLVRALGADLAQLAAHRAVEHVLLVSDDERLWPAVDQAQLQGLAVHILMDDTGTDFPRLQRDDPSWARLLAQADRRVLLTQPDGPTGLPDGPREERTEDRMAPPEDLVALEACIRGHLQEWWAEEPETQRLDLQDELRHSAMGLPQEVDRQLLLRLSRLLGHPLTWPEKKIMRHSVRQIVLGEGPDTQAPSVGQDG
jgi:hypothetical protein